MDFLKKINFYQNRINKNFFNLLNYSPNIKTSLIDAMKYSFLKGKRLRPILVYAIGEMLESNLINLDVPALAIECIHTYSLIHDDLPCMDNDTFRRGKQSCHIKYGENIAILTGNVFQTLAFSILSDNPMPNVSNENRILMISELAKSSGIFGICSGQALDLISNTKKKIDLNFLKKIYKYKTVSLIKASIRLGAIASGKLGKNYLSELDQYSNVIGLAFQIQDDIIDLTIDSKKNNLKKTYPNLVGLKKAKKKVSDLYAEGINILNIIKKNFINISFLKKFTKFIIMCNK